ncbi:MAG: PspC domain-containing protein [Candidatus Brocadiia bacterium]
MKRENAERHGAPYRARDGMILGVCKGLAEHLNVSVFWTRMVALAVLILTGVWPIVGLYLLAALLMKPEPVVPFQSEADEEFYNSFTSSRRMALHRLKRTFDRLDRRIRRMEGIVTDRERRWRQRLES